MRALHFLETWPMSLRDMRANDRPAIFLAAAHGHVPVLQWFKDQGMTLEDWRANESASVIMAACLGHVPVLQWFKDNGVSTEDVRANQNRALRWAAQKGHLTACQFLKDWGLTPTDACCVIPQTLCEVFCKKHVRVLQFFKGWFSETTLGILELISLCQIIDAAMRVADNDAERVSKEPENFPDNHAVVGGSRDKVPDGTLAQIQWFCEFLRLWKAELLQR
jgi:hypothetical protein